MGLEGDVSRKEDWTRVVREATERFGGAPAILANIAGLSVVDDTLDPLDEGQARRMVEVNQMGPALGMAAVLPVMIAAGRAKVVNISSGRRLIPRLRDRDSRGLASWVAS